MTEILLVRHGDVEGISPERFGGRAILPLTARGWRASEAAREWFAENRFQDYLYLHGLSVEMAEAFAEYLHKRIRGELGFAAEEARDPEAMLAQGYRGSRYSFGYPACPNLADQRLILE